MAYANPLLEACCSGNVDNVRHLLTDHDVNETDEGGRSPLLVASEGGHLAIVKALLGVKDISVSRGDAGGFQPIHVAARGGHSKVITQLIKHYADINAVTSDGATPLCLSCEKTQVACVKFLLEKGANPALARDKGATPLHIAADLGCAAIVQLLLKYPRVDVNAQTETGSTALYFACPSDDSNVAVQGKDKVKSPTKVKTDHALCVKLLLKKGADPDLANNDGWCPLHAASYFSGHVDIVRLLISAKAKVNAAIKEGATALHLAAQEGHDDCLKLLAPISDIDVQKLDGATPLYMAASSGHLTCLQRFLAAGADPNIGLKEDFRRPIHVATEKGHRDCVEALLNYPLDFDLEGRTSPITLATSHEFKEIATILKDYDKSKVTKGKKRSSGLFGCFTDLLPKDIISRSNAPTEKPAERPLEGATGGAADTDTTSDNKENSVEKERKVVIRDTKPKKGKDDKEKTGKDGGSKTEEIHRRRSNIQGQCSYLDFARRFLKQLNLPELYFDCEHDVCFCENCHTKRGDNLYYKRGEPPKDYGLPIGWVKFGLKAPPRAFVEDAFNRWHVAFHGTAVDCVGKIIKTGELLMPGDVTPEGHQLRPPGNHFSDDTPGSPKPPPGHDVSRIYLSPSIKYSGGELYSPSSMWTDPEKVRASFAQVALQVRIQPGTYDTSEQTMGVRRQIDPKFPNCQLEWSTKRRGVTVLVGLLVKVDAFGSYSVPRLAAGKMAAMEPTITQKAFDG